MKYFIDGRKVADEGLVDTWKDFCAGVEPPFPDRIEKIKSGQNMVGLLTNLNMYGRLLTDDEMKKVFLIIKEIFYIYPIYITGNFVPTIYTRRLHKLGCWQVLYCW